MPAAGAPRDSTPSRLPIHAQVTPRRRRAAATASPGLVWPPVPPPVTTTSARTSAGGALVVGALEGELEEALDERVVVEAGGLPQPRVRARRGEARDGVDLVHERPIAVEEEVDARHARAVHGAEGGHGQLPH